MELQNILIQLRSKLENDYRFRHSELVGQQHISQSTAPIQQFLAWLESTPEVKEILQEISA